MPNPLDFLLGSGLLAGSVLTDKEPGEVVQARQFLRNQFTSPVALSQGLSQQVQGLGTYFEPLLRQQENQVLNQTQQRVAAGRPTSFSTAIGGPEVSALRAASEDVLVPRRQALYGELGLNALNQQTNAARYILESSKPDATSEALGKLAALLMASGSSGGQGTGGLIQGVLDLITGKKTGTPGAPGSPPGTPPTIPPTGNSVVDAILRNIGPISAAVPGGVNALTSLFATPGLTAAIAPQAAAETATAVQLLTAMGVPAEEAAASEDHPRTGFLVRQNH